MPIWAIIPVKPFIRAKSRLASVLSVEQRADLSRQCLEHTLYVLSQVPVIARTLVVSRDSAALAFARKHGAHTVTESGSPGLNPALRRATEAARLFGAHATLILPADLPLITVEDVQQLIQEEEGGPALTIAPDDNEDGTNALFIRPPGWIGFAFGANSFAEHIERARQAEMLIRVLKRPNLALDLDVPEDLARYQKMRG
jgi:2-phospho-L-lactate guanylyltransferase